MTRRLLRLTPGLFVFASIVSPAMPAYAGQSAGPFAGPINGPAPYRRNFDDVTPPNLPSGWTAAISPGADPAIWVTAASSPDSAPNVAIAQDVNHVTDNVLNSESTFTDPITNRRAIIFRQSYVLENEGATDCFDGGVLEISIAGGPFQDITAAGGVFLANGYRSGVVNSSFGNPLGGRHAWCGSSNGYVTTIVTMPAAATGQTVMLRWRLGTDASVAAGAWRLDNLRILRWPHVDYDFNYDFKTDRTVFRPSTGTWYTALNGGGATATVWGGANDIDVAGDYDADGKVDIAVFRQSTGTWYIVPSGGGAIQTIAWGQNGDIPLAGDVDSDGKDDQIIYRTGSWYVKKSTGTTGFLSWGGAGDQPVLADWDADGIADPTVFRPSNGFWYGYLSGGGSLVFGWGANGDIPVPGDYDGDGKADVAVFRPSTGQWFISRSTNGTTIVVTWGTNGDLPVAGDWDGDGRADYSVWRPSDGHWYTQYANGGTADVNWGTFGDKPSGRRPGS